MTKPSPLNGKKPEAQNGWAIYDPEGLIDMVCVCESDKFIWRKFTKPLLMPIVPDFTQEDYERMGYRAIRVLITPLP